MRSVSCKMTMQLFSTQLPLGLQPLTLGLSTELQQINGMFTGFGTEKFFQPNAFVSKTKFCRITREE